MSKLLLYCTKTNLSLYRDNTNGKFFTMKPYEERYSNNYDNIGMQNRLYNDECCTRLNGKIVAECDFDVEAMQVIDGAFTTHTLNEKELLNKNCLTFHQMFDYFANTFNYGYAIHINNLNVFDKPRELSEYCYAIYPHTSKVIDEFRCNDYSSITDMYECDKAPQNMARVFTWDWNEGKSDDTYILISIQPQWLCKILNGEKTIEVRRKVLKEMLEND